MKGLDGWKVWVRRLANLLTYALIGIFLLGLFASLYLIFPPPTRTIVIVGRDTQSEVDALAVLVVEPDHLQVSIGTLSPVSGLDGSPNADSAAWSHSLGITIDDVIQLTYEDLVMLVDTVDGIRVDVPRTWVDEDYPAEPGVTTAIRFDSGLQWMDGERALMYVRSLAPDAPDRVVRLREVLTAFMQRLDEPEHSAKLLTVVGSIDSTLSPHEWLLLSPVLLLNANRPIQLD